MMIKICLLGLLLTVVKCQSPSKLITFAYVVDVTGSMGSEIKTVRNAINNSTKHLEHFRRFGIDHFVLVAFSDPVSIYGSWAFNTIAALHNKTSALKASGGGDCPEYGFAGLLRAIDMSKPHSYIFYISDASPKDHYLEREVLTSARSKSIRIWIMATGCCGYCSSNDVYRRVANGTGGVYYKATETMLPMVLSYVRNSVLCRKWSALENPPRNIYSLGMKICDPRRTTPSPDRPVMPVVRGGATILTSSLMVINMIVIVNSVLMLITSF